MRQSKKLSLIETCVNVAIGYVIANIVWISIVNPLLFGGDVSFGRSLIVNAIFTFVSIVRGYVVRRFFETKIHNWVDTHFKG